MLASSIVSKVRKLIIDPDGTRWTDEELLEWLTDGQRTIVAALPSASVSVTTLSLVAGPRQALPSDGYKLLMVYRNLTSGGVSGNSINRVSHALLQHQYYSYPADANQATAVQVYAYDPDDPEAFYVYPANDGAGEVEVAYSVMPPALALLTDTLVVRDIFEPALVDYVMFRAHSKDSDYAGGEDVSLKYQARFEGFVATQIPAGG